MSGHNQHRIVTPNSTAREEQATAMEDTNRYVPPCNTSTTPAATGYDAHDRFGNDGQASVITTSHAPPQTAMPMGLDFHSHHDEHNRLIDRHGNCLDDGQALQPQSIEAFAPSTLNETAQRGNVPSQNLAPSATPSNGLRPVFPADYFDFDFGLDIDPRFDLSLPYASDQQLDAWLQSPSSAFGPNMFGAYNQRALYGSHGPASLMLPSGPPQYRHQLASSSGPIDFEAFRRNAMVALLPQQQEDVRLTGHYQLPPSPGRQQHMPRPDVKASTTHDQPPPYDDSDRGYPLLSPSEPSPPDYSIAAAYIHGNHATGDQNFVFNVGAFTGPMTNRYCHHPEQQQQQQQQQRPHPPQQAYPLRQPNNAFNFNQPNENVYNDPLHSQNNQTQHPSYANAAPTAPANPGTPKVPPCPPRAPGAKVGISNPADLTPLVTALRDLPPVSSTQRHPVRKTLKNPFRTTKKTEAQQVIRANFASGTGFLRENSKLMKWDRDLNVFPKDYWDFLIQGEPRTVERDEFGKRKTKRAKKIKEEEGGGEVKKQKTKMRAGEAAKAEVAGEDVGEENAAEGEVKEDNVATEENVEGDVAEDEDTSGQESSSSGFPSGSSEEGAVILNGLPCNNSGQLLSRSTSDLRGELVAGDANKLFKSGVTTDASGRFRKESGKVIGLTSVSRNNSEEGEKEGGDDGAEEGEGGEED